MVLGTYKDILTARATDKKIQKVSQDGGIVSALFTYALDEGIIEGAVVAGNTDTPWKPEPTIAMSADEIIANAISSIVIFSRGGIFHFSTCPVRESNSTPQLSLQ